MLNAEQVDSMQNSTPTNWSQHDNMLVQRSDGDSARFAGDDRLHVRFFTKPRLNPDKSNEANRAIYEDTVYVEIMMPGEKNNIVMRPAWAQDFQRFPKHYAAFQEGAEQVVGTPLTVLPFLSESQVEEFRYLNIRTVEQLAKLADSASQQVMGAQDLKAKAQKFLDALNSNERVLAENAELKARIAALEGGKSGKKEDKAEALFK